MFGPDGDNDPRDYDYGWPDGKDDDPGRDEETSDA